MTNLSNKMPKGIPFIIGNEAAERYSFYGMKAILVVFLVNFITDAGGELAVFTEEKAKVWFHIFVAITYALSLIGSFVSDIVWGKYKTIITLSVVYCIGHFILALFETRMGFLVGCSFIAVGAGGIKPCVSAHVGDQFDKTNAHLIEKMYSWFYFAINAGATIAYMTAEPLLRNEVLIEKGLNAAFAFGLPGVLMLIATIVFWMGRHHFISVKPAGWKVYSNELFSEKGGKLIWRLLPIYLFLSVFWSLFDQTGSSWLLQAKSDMMDKTVNIGFTTFEVFPSQLGSLNSIFILILIPFFAYFIYPFMRKFMKVNYFNKIFIGLVIMALSFGVIAWVQSKMDAGISMSIGWQVLAFFLLTTSEVMVSISSLEFSYTQAPKVMKSLILSFWLFAVAIGNGFTALINFAMVRDDGSLILEGADYFWFFTALMAIAAILFYIVNRNFKEEHHIQSEEDYEAAV